MSLPRGIPYAAAACALALPLLVSVVAPSQPAPAQPAPQERAQAADHALGSVEATLNGAVISLEPRAAAIPIDSPFGYAARVSLPHGASSVQIRLKVNNPSGKLMIQRTRFENNVSTGTAVAAFERATDDLNLDPGAYPVRLEVAIWRNGKLASKTLETELLIYDPERVQLPVAVTVRIGGQPLADPQGRFIADPSQFTRARDDVNRLAAWVLTVPEARLTLSVSPVLLREWAQIASGYEFAGPEGVFAVAADDPTPRAYAATLGLLRDAVESGRLELVSLGYADPDISGLSAHGLIADVDAQYAQGVSAIFASLETTPSTGTVPAGGCLPPSAMSTLARQGLRYVVVSPRCVRSKQSTAAPGAYRVDGPPITVLVTDDRVSATVESADPTRQVRLSFDRHMAAGATRPLVLRCDVGPGAATAEAVIKAVEAAESQHWMRVRLAREIAGRTPRTTVRLAEGRVADGAPVGYWEDVRDARRWSRALTAAIGENAPESVAAENGSLIAECAAWTGPSGDWALADRGRAFAGTAERTARAVLSPIKLRIEPITLPGTSGQVPVILANDSARPLTIEISVKADRGVRIDGPLRTQLDLSPKDNFVEIPVSLPNALSGRLTVTVSSAGLVLDSTTVTVRASYLDRLVMIAGVVSLLGIMLAFIIRRVRAAETGGGDSERDSGPGVRFGHREQG